MTKKTRTRGRLSGLPANWQWREGRPRWIPSPALRKAGWKGCDLKDAKGQWLGRGASIDAAAEINAAVAGWRSGAPAPAAYALIAPAGAVAAAPAKGAPARLDPLSIGRLVDLYVGTATTPPCDELRAKAAKTVADRRAKLKRLLDVLAGWAELPADGDAKGQAAYARDVAVVRAASVFSLEPQEGADGMVDLLHRAYWTLHRRGSLHQASAVIAAASAWLGWCRERRSRQIRNWAGEVSRETPPGRINPLSWAVVKALVEAADAMGYPSIGDAVVLGVDLSWSQVDRLALTWNRVVDHRCLTGAQGRAKTGRVGGTPLTYLGRQRLAQARLRQAQMPAHPTHVLWCEDTGAPWNEHHYRHRFAEVRARAAQGLPEAAKAWDADLRDTAFTWMREAGCGDDQVASRTLQSRKNVAALGDKHYGEIGPAIADQGLVLYEARLKAMGISLETPAA